ncbi:YdcF family protein [Parvibaculum sp.]|uniref:YdcF family protein n=1 Tax=Parvibaculum sp. TaxID=2024848 RepID=UPI0025E84A18|nr:YdcF family protein [Parvibaculum sp.]
MARTSATGKAGEKRQTPPGPDGPRRPVLSLVIGLAALALALYAGGFFVFTALIDRTPAANNGKADGIVVLTGGPERIAEGYRLLVEGRAKRMLISGVNPEVKARELAALVGGDRGKFDCCIDIGWQAIDTIGNAAETANWVHKRGYRSIILVTSTYHLPRARLELRRAMPGVEIMPHPVFQDKLHLDGWWNYPGTTRLLVSEYTKYLLTLTHLRAR